MAAETLGSVNPAADERTRVLFVNRLRPKARRTPFDASRSNGGPTAEGRWTRGVARSTSEWAAACVRRRYPDCETPIHVMPMPVRMQFFDERWIDERFTRTTAGWKPRVLFVGGDFVRKGGDELLAAWTSGELHRVATLDLVTDWPLDVSHMPGVRVIRDVASPPRGAGVHA